MNNLKIKTFTFEDNCVFKYNRENVEIVDIKVNSIVKGNNPPTSILVYTIIYKELNNSVIYYNFE